MIPVQCKSIVIIIYNISWVGTLVRWGNHWLFGWCRGYTLMYVKVVATEYWLWREYIGLGAGDGWMQQVAEQLRSNGWGIRGSWSVDWRK